MAAEATTGRKKIPAGKAEKDKHTRLLSWFHQEMTRQEHNRFQMAMDEDYYDSMQWTAEEEAELRGRGQSPTVYNEIKPMIDWLIGVERRTRTDFNVISAHDDSPEADEDTKVKTKLLKYIAEANNVEFERSSAADDMFKAGLGWIEVGINPDPDEEPIYTRAESWRNMIYDSLGPRRDLTDARYLFRFRMVDLDIAIAHFPDKEAQLRASCVNSDADHYMDYWNNKPIDDQGGYGTLPGKYQMYDSDAWMNNTRERVMLIEAWYKEPEKDSSKGVERLRMQMRCTIMTEKYIVMDTKSPYKHNRFPFVPYWAYRRKKDNAPYGPIRPVRGPQDSLNKRKSKALFILSTNQVIMEVDAVDKSSMTAEEVRDEMRAPDGFVTLAKGGLGKIKTNRENDVAVGHLQMAQEDQISIRNASGISSENLGRDSNITAGVALKAKAEQGGQLTAELFDNMLFGRQLEGELSLSLAEQYYDQPKVFSITGERTKRDYTRINQPDPQNPGQKLNDITERKAKYIIGEQAWKQSLQQAAFESLMQLLQTLAPVAPQVVMALLDTVFELADIPNKKLILQRVRTATGQSDPDEPMTPEQEQAKAQEQAIAKKQVESQLAQLDAEIAKAQATGKNLDAKSLETTMKALYVAMQAAQVITTSPGVTPVADELLKSGGMKDQNGGVIAPEPAAALPVEPPPPAMEQPGAAPQDIPQPVLGDGAESGIQTATGVDNMNQQPQGELP